MPAEQNRQLCSQPAAGLKRGSLEEEVQDFEPHLIFSGKPMQKAEKWIYMLLGCCFAEDSCWIFCTGWSLGYFIAFVHVEVIKAYIGKEKSIDRR